MTAAPVLAAAALDLNAIVSAILAGGFLTGLGVLIRAVTRRGSGITDSAERTVLLQERLLASRHHELAGALAELDQARDDADTARRQRDRAFQLVRYYRSRHGDPTDPRMRRIVVEQEGNGQ